MEIKMGSVESFFPDDFPAKAVAINKHDGLMNYGFIVIWRKIRDTSFFRDSYALHLALLLILQANHEDKKIVLNNQEIVIKRGQCICGRDKLAAATGIKPSTVRDKLQLLKNTGFCDIKSNNRFSIVTINKYNDYQNIKIPVRQQLRQPADSQLTASRQPADTNNNNNNYNNLIKSYPCFEVESFKTAFYAYLEMRVKIKKPATEHAQRLLLKELSDYSVENAIAMLEQSVLRSWLGVFPVKNMDKLGDRVWNKL
jgi:hypothetical protein